MCTCKQNSSGLADWLVGQSPTAGDASRYGAQLWITGINETSSGFVVDVRIERRVGFFDLPWTCPDAWVVTRRRGGQAVRDERKWELMGEDHRRLDLDLRIELRELVVQLQQRQDRAPERYADECHHLRLDLPDHAQPLVPVERLSDGKTLLLQPPLEDGGQEAVVFYDEDFDIRHNPILHDKFLLRRAFQLPQWLAVLRRQSTYVLPDPAEAVS